MRNYLRVRDRHPASISKALRKRFSECKAWAVCEGFSFGADDLRVGIITACPFVGWKQIGVGKRGGRIMLALGIVANAALVILLLVSGVLIQWTCLWWIVLMGLALAGGILIRRGWKLYRQG